VPSDAGAAPTAAPADGPSDASPSNDATSSNPATLSNPASPSGDAAARAEVVAGAAAVGSTEAPIASTADLAAHLAREAAVVKAEVEEIELLVNQAKTESARHETRRGTAAEKLNVAADRLATGGNAGAKDLAELANQLVTVARKAALMEAQIDLLEGKRKSALRLAETLDAKAEQASALANVPAGGVGGVGGARGTAGRAGGGSGDGGSAMPGFAELDLAGPLPPGVSRIILTAQEDLRREIARQMHDGPAQSLTNIVLQAQIVDRLMGSDPKQAQAEVESLIAMVQRTLDATKTFIFDVRPMVLDDLGLVPTLRRASRDRGRRVGVTVDFESVGVDRRLPVDLESGLFRMLDDALAAHAAGKPDRIGLHLDWGEHLVIELTAGRTPEIVPDPELPPEGSELPPALAEMVAERRRNYAESVEAARIRSLARLPEQAWRDVAGRARILGVKAEMLDDGARLHLEVDLPPASDGTPVGVPADPFSS
jgi:two-component system, NarL family, sensor histidine kinase DegS